MLSRSRPISHLATTHQVSRRFVYQQGDKAQRLLDGQLLRRHQQMTQKLTIQQVKAKRREAGLVARAQDVKILCQWFSYDVLALAGPDLAIRQELFDFIESEFQQRAGKSPKQLLTGETHPHWLELLGFERFQRA